MDIKLEKRAWYIRHKYWLLAGVAALGLIALNISLVVGPRTKLADADDLEIAEVVMTDFHEYIDVTGIVQPILNIKVNCREGGYISRIVAGNGVMLDEGDTILVIENPELIRSIEEERLAWEKQQMNHRLQQYQMEQKSLSLRGQMLQAEYEMRRLEKSHNLDIEEARMGIKSKAQLEVSEDEYNYNLQKSKLTLESLKHDSAVNLIQCSLLDNELENSRDKYIRTRSRLGDLVVRSPLRGQLSYVSAIPGQRVSSGESIAEINILDDYKVHANLSEYYVDRISVGLPASVTYQGVKFPMKISKVVPEVKNQTFSVELVFTGEKPENARVGKSYNIQIELGSPEKALVIPRGKFYNSNGGRKIYKLSPSGATADLIPIVIGRQNPKQFEVMQGLSEGDKVIISEYTDYKDAERLRIK